MSRSTLPSLHHTAVCSVTHVLLLHTVQNSCTAAGRPCQCMQLSAVRFKEVPANSLAAHHTESTLW
jgi:hypothetical protein